MKGKWIIKKELIIFLIHDNISVLSKSEKFDRIYKDKLKDDSISIKEYCFLLGVTRSGYYNWIKEKKIEKKFDKDLLKLVLESYTDSKKYMEEQR